MRTKEKILLSWSGGKDSAKALYEIQTASTQPFWYVWQLCFGRKTISGFRPIFLEDN